MGNTKMLNKFVDELRMIANGDERMQKIILFNGPTATGKSELKRCVTNGLREYSKTDEGRKYTCEWNLSGLNQSSDLSYGDTNRTNNSDWYKSPVQVNPLSVIPQKARMDLVDDLDYDYDIPFDMDLDPFSKTVYDKLVKNYASGRSNQIFSSITDKKHFRIRRYTVDKTKGIGVLNAEDDGSVKERLLGSWMPSMIKELDSKGQKDPRAFSYDGVLSQGNSGVMIIEDATRHADILAHLLNIPDESHAKIDQKIGFDIDTVPIFISNPDLVENKLDSSSRQNIDMSDIHGNDPLKAVKRRIFQYQFKYLISLTYESKLLRRETNGKFGISDNVKPRDPVEINNTEFAPHTIEAATMYNVVSRLSAKDLPNDLSLVGKAMLFDRGYIETDDGKIDIEEFDIETKEEDGTFGIPVTYTRDIIRSLVHSSNREEIYLPNDLLDELNEGISSAPIFDEKEIDMFDKRLSEVRDYINKQQEDDVIDSILYERQVTDSAIEQYLDNLYIWYDDENDEEYDELLMKDFEVKHLGAAKHQYNGSEPTKDVENFRSDRIIKPLNRYHWRQRNDSFKIENLDLKEIPVLSSIIGNYSWQDVFNQHENLNPLNWENTSESTVTDEVKLECIKNMVEEYGYTEESARITSEKVFKRNKDELIELSEKASD
jgi:predicted Ser/Thr protein kinase